MAKKRRDRGKTDQAPQAPELSRVYRLGANEEPPAHLDAAILAQARDAVAPRRSFGARWMVPLSSAAVVVLSVSLLVFMIRETPLPERSFEERALLDSSPTKTVAPKAQADRSDLESKSAPMPTERSADAKKEFRTEPLPSAAPASPARERANESTGALAQSAPPSSAPPSPSLERSARLMAKQAARTVDLQIADRVVKAEIASTDAELERGLMYRDALAPDSGMLFIFPARESGVCMWMKDTRIPLSAAFIDSGGRILNIADMDPFSTAVHCAEGRARFVLEMYQGWFGAAGIKPGARIGGLPPLR
jgi:uncharacterized membrane protein (UPF0127 family)